MKNKGFTLIEILASLIILSIVLTIGVVAISRYIESSKETTYITQANKHIDNLIGKVTSREFSFRQTDTTYYVPIKCITPKDTDKSSFGAKIVSAYVVVTFDGESHKYYYTQRDSDNKGITLVDRKALDTKIINKDLKSINLSVGVGNRPLISRYPDNCNGALITTNATTRISE